ncbi:MAG: acetyl-CoA carboxylase biotin carboxyl carrier protein [Zetaproteobacteria bacterium]|nr:MAG: acetyl-CoA carboxylase biotin carboxyl carrier protein [Zetaproteobacteria bacterium]
MDISTIRKLIRIFEKSKLSELEVREGDLTIRLSRRGEAAASEVVSAPAAPAPAEAPEEMAPAERPAQAPAQEAAPELVVVRSPMVGTFYRAPSPDAEPFVREGQRIKKGDVLCIIEAMKLMNEIEAELDGVIERILVENAQPVEYGQPLFEIRPL